MNIRFAHPGRMRPGLHESCQLDPYDLLPRLYAIVDTAYFPTQLCAYADELVAAGCTFLQYRNKSGNARVMLEQARELQASREQCSRHTCG